MCIVPFTIINKNNSGIVKNNKFFGPQVNISRMDIDRRDIDIAAL